jgi:hypothetical protein
VVRSTWRVAGAAVRSLSQAFGRLASRLTERPCGQPQPIGSDQRLWRRVIDHPDHVTWDADKERWLPRPSGSSNSLQFNPELSTFWCEHLQDRHRLLPSSILDPDGRYTLVYQSQVQDVRAIGCTVEHTPQADLPVDCAHTSVWYPSGATDKPSRKAVRNDLARTVILVYGAISQSPPDGA